MLATCHVVHIAPPNSATRASTSVCASAPFTQHFKPVNWSRKLLNFALALVVLLPIAAFAAGEEPKVYSLAPGALAKAKARLASDDQSAKAPLEKLLTDAEAALKQKPPSVMDKPMAPGTR